MFQGYQRHSAIPTHNCYSFISVLAKLNNDMTFLGLSSALKTIWYFTFTMTFTTKTITYILEKNKNDTIKYKRVLLKYMEIKRLKQQSAGVQSVTVY